MKLFQPVILQIYQVHHATLHDGTEVAVKVQHKFVKKHSFVDIVTMDFLVRNSFFQVFVMLEVGWGSGCMFPQSLLSDSSNSSLYTIPQLNNNISSIENSTLMFRIVIKKMILNF